MSRPPALQFFCKDWIAKCQGLSLEEEGAYIRLFNAARTTSDDWCSLPDDDSKLARIVGVGPKKWRKLRPRIVPEFFVTENGRLVNLRLREEAEIQRNRREQQSIAGKASATTRANIRSTHVEHPDQRKGNSASASAVDSKTCAATQRADAPVALAPEGTPTAPLDGRAVVSAIASSVALEPKPAERPYVALVYEIAKPHGPEVTREALQLAGRLYNSGIRTTDFLTGVVSDWIPKRNTIRNPFAYYSPGADGFGFVQSRVSRASHDAESARLKAEERDAR